jgi:hypothetical protein
MNDAGNALLSVRAEARELVVPDSAVVDGLIERTAGSKAEALRLAASSVDHLTADLAALGGVPFEESAQRRPLTWSAHSSATREERYHDKETGRSEPTGQVTATVALRVTVRDLDMLDAVSGILATHQSLDVHAVTWHVDWDNPGGRRSAPPRSEPRSARPVTTLLRSAARCTMSSMSPMPGCSAATPWHTSRCT